MKSYYIKLLKGSAAKEGPAIYKSEYDELFLSDWQHESWRDKIKNLMM